MSDDKKTMLDLDKETPGSADHVPTYPLETSTKEAFMIILKGIPALLKLLYRLLRNERTPKHIKWWIGGSALYLIVPINLKFKRFKTFPMKMVNYVDDVVVIVTVIQRVLKQTDPDLLEELWEHELSIHEWQDMLYKLKTDLSSYI